MNDHDEENPVIPKIPPPIFPEPRRIEIWPGVPTEKKPVPLEGPGHGVREVNDPQPSLAPQPQTGGSGKGGRGSNLPPTSAATPKTTAQTCVPIDAATFEAYETASKAAFLNEPLLNSANTTTMLFYFS